MQSGDWNLALLQNSGGSAEAYARVQRIRATVDWVRVSCERDGWPPEIVAAVVKNVEAAFIRGDFPLAPQVDERSMR